jgi:hypothetical protein
LTIESGPFIKVMMGTKKFKRRERKKTGERERKKSGIRSMNTGVAWL